MCGSSCVVDGALKYSCLPPPSTAGPRVLDTKGRTLHTGLPLSGACLCSIRSVVPHVCIPPKTKTLTLTNSNPKP